MCSSLCDLIDENEDLAFVTRAMGVARDPNIYRTLLKRGSLDDGLPPADPIDEVCTPKASSSGAQLDDFVIDARGRVMDADLAHPHLDRPGRQTRLEALSERVIEILTESNQRLDDTVATFLQTHAELFDLLRAAFKESREPLGQTLARTLPNGLLGLGRWADEPDALMKVNAAIFKQANGADLLAKRIAGLRESAPESYEREVRILLESVERPALFGASDIDLKMLRWMEFDAARLVLEAQEKLVRHPKKLKFLARLEATFPDWAGWQFVRPGKSCETPS